MTADDGGWVIVLPTRHVHAYVHTLKYECLLTFLTNENMTMYNI